MGASWQAFYAHLCAASIIRAMPETEIPPAMRGDLYYFKQFSALYYFLFYEQEKVKCDWLNSSEHGVFINLFIFFRHIWKYGHLSP